MGESFQFFLVWVGYHEQYVGSGCTCWGLSRPISPIWAFKEGGICEEGVCCVESGFHVNRGYVNELASGSLWVTIFKSFHVLVIIILKVFPLFGGDVPDNNSGPLDGFYDTGGKCWCPGWVNCKYTQGLPMVYPIRKP